MRYADIVRRCYNDNILFSALLELTYRCNLDCTFCYNDRELRGTPLSLDQYDRLLQDLCDMGTLNLALSGGEPLAHPDFFRIGARARELGFAVRVKSNGHALRGTMLRRLKDEIDPFSFDLSLHGADAETHDRQTRVPGSFAALMRNVREMRALGMRLKFNVPLTCWNEHHIEQIFAIADELGVSLQVDSSITPRDNGDRAPLALAASPEGLTRLGEIVGLRRAEGGETDAEPPEVITPPDKHCGSGSATATIDPFGNVYPCVQLRRAAGSLHSQSIGEIWRNSQVLAEVRGLTAQVKQWIDTLGPGGKSMGFCPGIAYAQRAAPWPCTPWRSCERRLQSGRADYRRHRSVWMTLRLPSLPLRHPGGRIHTCGESAPWVDCASLISSSDQEPMGPSQSPGTALAVLPEQKPATASSCSTIRIRGGS